MQQSLTKKPMSEKTSECCGSGKCCCGSHSKKFYLAVVFLVGLFIFWGFRVAEMWTSISGDYPREITVEGEGKGYAVPDIAKLTLGVSTTGAKSDLVVAENSKKVNKVIEELKTFKIDAKDVKTVDYYLGQNYNYKGELDGYMLNQSMVVIVRDFNQIGEIVTKTSKVGANSIGGIVFEVENKVDVKSRAREEAIKNAKATAANIEKQTGLKLKDIKSYYEYENISYDGKGGYGGDMMSAAPAPEIQPGQEEMVLKVSLTYQVD